MFYKAFSFNGDISSWKVSNVTNMNDMFKNASALSADNRCNIFNLWYKSNINNSTFIDILVSDGNGNGKYNCIIDNQFEIFSQLSEIEFEITQSFINRLLDKNSQDTNIIKYQQNLPKLRT